MDFFPDLGEPGLLDELFYAFPFVLQVVLGFFFFWLLGRWMKKARLSVRIVAVMGLVIATDILLFILFVVVFSLANPTL